MCNVTMRSFRVTIVAVEKLQVLHILSVCVCSLKLSNMQSACAVITLSPVACLALTYFFHIISKTEQFSEKKMFIEHKMCFRFRFNLCLEIFLISRINE